MGGGLMQLVAFGAQDVLLQVTRKLLAVKVVYRRHTNFSMETIQQTIEGSASSGGIWDITISKEW